MTSVRLRDMVGTKNNHRVRPSRDYIYVILQHTLRTNDNAAIELGILEANKLGKKLILVHLISNFYPFPSARFHTFIFEASKSLEDNAVSMGLGFIRFVANSESDLERLAFILEANACSVYADTIPLNWAKIIEDNFLLPCRVKMTLVQTLCLVPTTAIDSNILTTPQFRAAHRDLRPRYLELKFDSKIKNKVTKTDHINNKTNSTLIAKGSSISKIVENCMVDHSLPELNDWNGRREAGLKLLERAVDKIVKPYKWIRNNPALSESTSGLSPYIHYGIISPHEIVRAIDKAEISASASWKFKDELLVWREFAFHQIANSELSPTDIKSIPVWAYNTLDEHRADPRLNVYRLDQLLFAETEDPIWNAAQIQFLNHGWMHNNFRMYWVKQFLKWTQSPEDAWSFAIYMNDRLSLDGRDPATYLGIQWGFGRSKKAWRENQIYGWVPTKTSAALKKRKGVNDLVDDLSLEQRLDIELYDPSSVYW